MEFPSRVFKYLHRLFVLLIILLVPACTKQPIKLILFASISDEQASNYGYIPFRKVGDRYEVVPVIRKTADAPGSSEYFCTIQFPKNLLANSTIPGRFADDEIVLLISKLRDDGSMSLDKMCLHEIDKISSGENQVKVNFAKVFPVSERDLTMFGID